ncbi:ABC-2 type transport system ATP-binding protein [Thermocatellispora tengchongensis]|uniref:ABC-2 type transport system ATP-binding protein n=1 Tax=Thermocatellispora tengchongensis TaxID=1073253 RepID=A0A840PIR4_9ACTN|nr:ABC transporter ATP-binding protein [Thermocatellispora tengchongensis]MBB5137440.1 ABC-2 type transport system ATP-binding protein [Thermocatellispora tengchongensis]
MGDSERVPTIEAAGLTKRYGEVVAVDEVGLQVASGDIYALVGLNGAGKTTLIRMLLGMIAPTRGTVRVLGAEVSAGDRSAWARTGYLIDTPAAYSELTVRENLHLIARLRRLPGPAARVGEVIHRLALTPYADRRARTLSMGNAQRLALAKALIHRPDLLILDEPVNGLDPAGVVEIRNLLSGLAREHGTTVLLSSHLLGEVTRLATRIAVIHNGRLLTEIDPHRLHGQTRRLEVATRDDARAARVLAERGLSPAPAPAPGDGLVLAEEHAVEHPDRIATALVEAGCPPTRLVVREEDLEQYFLRLVGQADA